jgi:hypothetical protein
MQDGIMSTYSPLHSVYNKSSRTADSDAAEEYGCTFILIGTPGNAEGAWPCCLLLSV